VRKPQPLTPEQGVTYALRLLNQRHYSVHTLKTKLLWRGLTDAEAEAIVKKLTDLNLLNDARYAESLLRDETEFRHKSRRYAKQKLAAKGIDKQIIDTTLEHQETPEETELANVLLHAERYVKRHPDLDLRQPTKLIANLSGKGFDYALIKQAIAHLRNQE
jgi:regulatory protein